MIILPQEAYADGESYAIDAVLFPSDEFRDYVSSEFDKDENGVLSDEEIEYYVSHYRPFDKAGAYGIQEWIGHIGVTGMSGSYFNVMGLPVQRIYEALKTIQNL